MAAGTGPESAATLERTRPTDVSTQDGAALTRRGGMLWTFVAVVVLTALTWARHPAVFTTPLYAGGDEGLNSLLTIRAEHFDQLAGNYSRVGFNHPGPALVYLLAAGETVFHTWLGIVPADYNGQILAVTLYAVTLIVLTGGALGRLVRSRWAATAAVAVMFSFAAAAFMAPASAASTSPQADPQLPWLSSVWFPYLYAPAFLAFVVGAALFGSGRTSELPLAVLGGGLLVHGHVAFLLFVGVGAAVSITGWVVAHRGSVRTGLRPSGGALSLATVLLVLFVVPIVVRTVRDFPDPWRSYLAFSGGERDPRSLGDAVAFVARYWSETPWPVWVYVPAGLILVAAAVVPSRARAGFAWLVWAVILQSGLAVVYAYRGVDHLDQRYVEEFYKTVPLLVVAGAVTAVAAALVASPARRTAGRAVIAVGTVATVALGASQATLSVLPAAGTTYQEAALALRDAPARAGRAIAVEHAQLEVWPGVSGVVVQLERMSVPWCVVAPAPLDVALLYTPLHVCRPGEDTWRVAATTGAAPPGSTPVWSGPTVYVPLTLYPATGAA